MMIDGNCKLAVYDMCNPKFKPDKILLKKNYINIYTKYAVISRKS